MIKQIEKTLGVSTVSPFNEEFKKSKHYYQLISMNDKINENTQGIKDGISVMYEGFL